MVAIDDAAAEQSPLLQLPVPEPKQGWTRDATRTVVLVGAFLAFGSIAEVYCNISSVRLLELGFCREYYLEADPTVIDSHGNIPERLCKLPGIQQDLAQLRGSMGALVAVVSFMLAIPYGLIINRVGERTLGVINLFGFLLSSSWLLIVCFFWEIFPTKAAIYGPLFRIIGGSTPVMASILFSITAKHVPEESRSLSFFFFGAVQLVAEIFSISSAAFLVDHQFLFLPLLLNLPLGVLCVITVVLMPANNSTEPTEDNGTGTDAEDKPKMIDSVRNSGRLMLQLLRNRNLVILLATTPIAFLRIPIAELWLQYIPKKFDLSLGSASRVISIQAIESLILLVILLPVLKEIAQVRFRVHSNKVDLRIVQFGYLFMTLGCLAMALAQRLMSFIFGLLIFTLGVSTRLALQSVLTDLVSREQIAVLYIIIAVGDGIGMAGGQLVLNKSFALAIGWDDKMYFGLPFLIAAGCYFCGCGCSLFAGHSTMKDKGEED